MSVKAESRRRRSFRGLRDDAAGFTLVEMVVTLGIITIMVGATALAAPGLFRDARTTRCLSLAEQIGEAEDAFYSKGNQRYADLAVLAAGAQKTAGTWAVIAWSVGPPSVPGTPTAAENNVAGPYTTWGGVSTGPTKTIAAASTSTSGDAIMDSYKTTVATKTVTVTAKGDCVGVVIPGWSNDTGLADNIASLVLVGKYNAVEGV